MEDKIFYAKNRKEWRNWLKKNHEKEKKIALLIYKKHTGKPSLSHKETMEEAICFGWIDTTIKRIDEDTFIRRFAKRTDKANWSTNTLSYASDLLKRNLMHPQGIKTYEEGKKKLPFDHNRSKNPETTEDLKESLKHHNLTDNFNNIAPPYRRTYLYWLERAKGKETRQKRINHIINNIKSKQKPGKLKISKD